MCLSRLQDTPGSFLFHHKTIFITLTVDSYNLHNLKFIALLRLQHLWHYQATQISRNFQSYLEFSGIFMSYVILITFLLENIFLDYSLKSTIKDLNVFLHNVLCGYEGLVIGGDLLIRCTLQFWGTASLSIFITEWAYNIAGVTWIFKNNLSP